MPEAVAAEVLTAEPPCHHDNLVPQTLSFEYSKNDHAGSGLAVVVLNHLITAEETLGIVRGLGKSPIVLQLGKRAAGVASRSVR